MFAFPSTADSCQSVGDEGEQQETPAHQDSTRQSCSDYVAWWHVEGIGLGVECKIPAKEECVHDRQRQGQVSQTRLLGKKM